MAMKSMIFHSDFDQSIYSDWLHSHSVTGGKELEAKVRHAAAELKATIALLREDIVTMLGSAVEHAGNTYTVELYR